MTAVEVLSVAELADLAEVAPGTIREHLRQGRLRGRKTGRDWVITGEDARAWLESYSPYDTLRRPR